MTAFIDEQSVRDYLGVTGTTGSYSTAQLGSNIRAASYFLQKETGRQFEAQSATTKKFTTDGRAQLSIPDIRTVSSLTLQGAAQTADAGYWLVPDRMNSGIYVAVQLRQYDTGALGYLANPQWFDRNLDRDWARGRTSLPNDLSITGDWGWATYPEPLLHATKLLAGWYTLRPSSVLANVSVTAEGTERRYGDLPPEVVSFIEQWRLGDQAVGI